MSKKEKILLVIFIITGVLVIVINECYDKSKMKSKKTGIKTEMVKR